MIIHTHASSGVVRRQLRIEIIVALSDRPCEGGATKDSLPILLASTFYDVDLASQETNTKSVTTILPAHIFLPPSPFLLSFDNTPTPSIAPSSPRIQSWQIHLS